MFFEVYSSGLCYMSVCTDLTPEKAAEHANAVTPSGTSHGWAVSKEKEFKTGQPNPCPCDRNPQRIHILLEC